MISRGSSLEGDVAIITGGAQGIGEATSRLFAERGASVVVADFNMEKAQSVASEIRQLGHAALAFEVDVTKSEQLDALVAATVEKYEKINHLVNNAGVALDGMLVRQSDDEFEKTIDVNLVAPRHLTSRVARFMLENGHQGSISFASSTTADSGKFGQTAYGASKGGIETLAMAFSREVGQKGIRVNAVAPGPVETPMLGQISEEDRAAMQNLVALNRLASPAEIAQVYAWLASDDASYIAGTVIKVDGGFKKG